MNPAPETTVDLQTEYLRSLSQKEIQAYHIAKSHLGTTFDLGKSIGFIEWKQHNQQNEK
jgi:hypothetical protein